MKLKLSIFALISLLFSTSVFAYSSAHNQFYVGVQGGYGGMLTYRFDNLPNTTGGYAGTTSYTGQKIHSGFAYRTSIGYLFTHGHDQFGLEAGYMGYPKNTYDIDNQELLIYKGNSVDLLLVMKHNYDDGFNVFAKFGGAYVTQRLENASSTDITIPNSNGTSIFGRSTKVLPEAALGFGYELNRHVSVDLGANYIFAGDKSQNLNSASTSKDMNRVASVIAGLIGVYVQF